MPRCWTCGRFVSDYRYECAYCETLTQIKDFHQEFQSYQKNIAGSLNYITQVQREGFEAIKTTIMDGLSEIASAIEWGFEEANWQLQQQKNILLSIDHTLQTPAATQANEWRKMAEELRQRKALDDSEEFYLKALKINRLDYRIYIGLAQTYLQMNKFDKAQYFLEKSLPHAPKEKIDYKSYSYRLIGHIYACEENYEKAAEVLRLSIELSPDYAESRYDYAQYCAQLKNIDLCLSSLQNAIFANYIYWYLAHKEQNFDPVREEVQKLLRSISTEASNLVKDAVAKFENVVDEAHKAISRAKQALAVARESSELESIQIVDSAEKQKETALEMLRSEDYEMVLKALPIINEACILAQKAISKADDERKHYEKVHEDKIAKVHSKYPSAFIGYPLTYGFGGWVLFGFGGCLVRVVSGYESVWEPFNSYVHEALLGFLIGGIGGLIYGIHKIRKELR